MNDNRFPHFLTLVRWLGFASWVGFAIPAHRVLGFAIPLLLLTACDPGRHERMQQKLAELQTMNQADSVLTDDSLAQALADYFDRHGTPNEQMEAHYLLGRTHADRGEAPAALAAYHDAIDRADTTAKDCNYRQLYKIYGQMSDIFYRQNLMDYHLERLNKAAYYAYLAKDTLTAIHFQAYKMATYDKLCKTDSVIAVFRQICNQFKKAGHPEIIPPYSAFVIKAFLLKGSFADAKECMDAYESKSGYFNADGSIRKGMEAYYSLKGRYFLATSQLDSAYFYFDKEMKSATDFNNQNMGAKGLASLYSKKGNADSALWYALYCYDMNDSIYSLMSTKDVANAQELYDYTRHLKTAQQEKERSEHLRNQVSLLLCVIALLIILAIQTIRYFRRKRKEEIQERKELQDALLYAQTDLLNLRSQRQMLENVIAQDNITATALSADLEGIKRQYDTLARQLAEKEELVERLQKDLTFHLKKEHLTKESVEEKMRNSDVFKMLTTKSRRGEKLTEDEWADLHRMVLEVIPGYNHFLINKRHSINDIQYETCLLLRLHVPQSSISEMLGVSASYIQKMCKKSLETLFEVEGTGTDLYKRLVEIC